MKSFRRLMIYVLLLTLIDVVIWCTVHWNRRHGVYPTVADTIMIPLVETVFMTILGGGALLVTWLATSFWWPYRKAAGSRAWRCGILSLFAVLYLALIVFFFLWALSWFGPDHYLIAASCLLAVCVLVAFCSWPGLSRRA